MPENPNYPNSDNGWQIIIESNISSSNSTISSSNSTTTSTSGGNPFVTLSREDLERISRIWDDHSHGIIFEQVKKPIKQFGIVEFCKKHYKDYKND